MNIKPLIFLILFTAFGCDEKNQSNSIFDELKGANIQSVNSLELANGNDDLSILKTIVQNSQIVCLGESRHDISEQFKLKNKLVKYLIEELGFRTFVLEASLPYSNQLNNYLRTGNGNLEQIMAEMPGWFLWDTQELQELLVWIKEFNEQTEDKVSFYGFDIVAPNNGYEQIFDYLRSVNEAKYNQIKNDDFGRETINDKHWPSTLEQFASISEERQLIAGKNIDELYQHLEEEETAYINKTSKEEYQWILTLAYSAKEAIRMFTTTDRIEMGLIRDNAMANICKWIINKEGRTIVWAHNVHIAKSEFTMSMFPDQKIKGMGAILSDEFNDKMISVGGTFGKGEFENEGRSFPIPDEYTIDGELSKLEIDNLIVDLKHSTSKPKVIKWLKSEHTLKGQEFEMSCIPIDAFDALYYTNKISKVRYNPATEERMGN
jgi:erythromycin esterase